MSAVPELAKQSTLETVLGGEWPSTRDNSIVAWPTPVYSFLCSGVNSHLQEIIVAWPTPVAFCVLGVNGHLQEIIVAWPTPVALCVLGVNGHLQEIIVACSFLCSYRNFWVSLHLIPACISYSYKNGSFTRENVRDSCAGGNWAEFNTLLNSTVPGNDGNIGESVACKKRGTRSTLLLYSLVPLLFL